VCSPDWTIALLLAENLYKFTAETILVFKEQALNVENPFLFAKIL